MIWYLHGHVRAAGMSVSETVALLYTITGHFIKHTYCRCTVQLQTRGFFRAYVCVRLLSLHQCQSLNTEPLLAGCIGLVDYFQPSS